MGRRYVFELEQLSVEQLLISEPNLESNSGFSGMRPILLRQGFMQGSWTQLPRQRVGDVHRRESAYTFPHPIPSELLSAV